MNGSLNKVMLIGHLGDDVKIHHFEGGGSIGRFPLATNESYTKKDSGEKVTETEWHNIVVRNKVAEICSNITGVNLSPVYKKDRPKEVKHATCSADKARSLLNYKTKVSLKDGINKTFEYIKKRGVKNFDYNIKIEIDNELTPSTWKNKEI